MLLLSWWIATQSWIWQLLNQVFIKLRDSSAKPLQPEQEVSAGPVHLGDGATAGWTIKLRLGWCGVCYTHMGLHS